MKTAHIDANAHTETLEDVAAQLRAEYANHTPEQRERLGDEPSYGTIAGEWARRQCNNQTPEQRAYHIARGMAIIYGSAAKFYAKQQVRS